MKCAGCVRVQLARTAGVQPQGYNTEPRATAGPELEQTKGFKETVWLISCRPRSLPNVYIPWAKLVKHCKNGCQNCRVIGNYTAVFTYSKCKIRTNHERMYIPLNVFLLILPRTAPTGSNVNLRKFNLIFNTMRCLWDTLTMWIIPVSGGKYSLDWI
jgi:hypothetical protein